MKNSPPPSELYPIASFVRNQIKHKIGRKTWSNEWTENHVHDVAIMIWDYHQRFAIRPTVTTLDNDGNVVKIDYGETQYEKEQRHKQGKCDSLCSICYDDANKFKNKN